MDADLPLLRGGSRLEAKVALDGSRTVSAYADVDRSCRKAADAVKTTRERAEEKRQAKLDLVREQVDNGSLVIRPMTEEERRRYPPRPAPPKRLPKR